MKEDDPLSPVLSKMMAETAILFKLFETHFGRRMEMPDRIRTSIDKVGPDVHAGLKMAMVCQLAGAWVDKHFMAELPPGSEKRGQVVTRLSVEIYRMLTDGLSIDAVRALIKDPDPTPKDRPN